MSKIQIRKALVDDANIFTNCHISCWQTAYKEIVPDDFLSNMSLERNTLYDRYKKVLTDPGDCEYYCVMLENRMIGFLIINKNVQDDNNAIGEIWAIYLIEEFCGTGIGKQLLDFEIQELKKINPKEIFLWVFEANTRARKFYEKSGFCYDGTKREEKYGIPITQLRYVLNHSLL